MGPIPDTRLRDHNLVSDVAFRISSAPTFELLVTGKPDM